MTVEHVKFATNLHQNGRNLQQIALKRNLQNCKKVPKTAKNDAFSVLFVVLQRGFEPRTPCLKGRCLKIQQTIDNSGFIDFLADDLQQICNSTPRISSKSQQEIKEYNKAPAIQKAA